MTYKELGIELYGVEPTERMAHKRIEAENQLMF